MHGEKDHGHTPIYNSIKDNKVSSNNPNQGGVRLYSENINSLL